MKIALAIITNTKGILLTALLLCTANQAISQESVFNLFQSEVKRGDKFYAREDYHQALDMYMSVAQKNKAPADINLKMGRCYFFLKQNEKAVKSYDKYLRDKKELSGEDIYYYAEAQAGIGNYGYAVESYKNALAADPSNELLVKKIWRLNNIRFLYEDSVHFAIRKIDLNTGQGEFAARPYNEGIVFVSNREEIGFVQKIDASHNSPFYKLYFSSVLRDSAKEVTGYGKAALFDKGLGSGFHAGPVAFYEAGNKMVLTTSGTKKTQGKSRTLQLQFAKKTEKGWEITGSFPYNDLGYSNSDPTISEDGKVLFFTSDMKGGVGGKDIYRSENLNGQWSKPTNIDAINTAGDEAFPYLHLNETLYFSSNGHPGLGALDIFKTHVSNFGEIQNVGYPLNSSYDDFGITLDSLSRHGYFTSNRDNGGYNDDIYEFDMDIQPYPLQVSGVVKYIEHNWVDSSELKILANAKLVLVDNFKNEIVAETVSDEDGNFTIVVPYFSKYKVHVERGDIREGIVSFEVPKHKKLNDKYEIVVVNDDFKSDSN